MAVGNCEIVTEVFGATAVTMEPAGIPVPVTDWPTKTPVVLFIAMVLEENVVLPVCVVPESEIVTMGAPV